ncbi:MAG: hypothetical protein ACM3MG_06980 [Bacillota bacterium]
MWKLSRKYPVFMILLTLEIAYLTIALMVPPLPGWKMFSEVDRVRHAVLIADGQKSVLLKDYLPSTFYELGVPTALKVAEFICQKRKDVQDWYLELEKDTYVFHQSDCLPRKK